FVAASIEHTSVLKKLSNENIQTVVDVGANRGQFAVAARWHLPAAEIISFEPLEEAAAVFKKIFQQDNRVVLHPFAIGNKFETTEIHVSNADDSSSLLPISELQEAIFPGTAEKETRTIEVKPLDEVIAPGDLQQPALLKLDVQGFEIEVLQGSGELLQLFSFVYVECSFVELYQGQSLAHDVIALLSSAGFKLVGIYNPSYGADGSAVQADFLFEKP
ncbi:MAG: FkbM family methyltransferase, partial [Anaerolineae bacterium]|nr:FkbM family methyltransferase [Anaerolineae bacterium]